MARGDPSAEETVAEQTPKDAEGEEVKQYTSSTMGVAAVTPLWLTDKQVKDLKAEGHELEEIPKESK